MVARNRTALRALAAATCLACGMHAHAGTATFSDLVVSNTFMQKGATSTNRFYGFLVVEPKSDVAMGVFTNGQSAGPAWWTNRGVVEIESTPSD